MWVEGTTLFHRPARWACRWGGSVLVLMVVCPLLDGVEHAGVGCCLTGGELGGGMVLVATGLCGLICV